MTQQFERLPFSLFRENALTTQLAWALYTMSLGILCTNCTQLSANFTQYAIIFCYARAAANTHKDARETSNYNLYKAQSPPAVPCASLAVMF